MPPTPAQPPTGRESWKAHTERVFENVRRENPGVFDGAQLLALGSYGLVVDHGDGTVSKIFLGAAAPEEQANREKLYRDETNVLRLLGGASFGGAQAPALLAETPLAGGEAGFASYRMPRLAGQEINWKDFLNTAPESAVESHFRSLGAVLAHFHAETPALAALTPPQKGIVYGAAVDAVPRLDARTNAALAVCDAYLQTHREPGVIHGDFHPQNFRTDEGFRATGLYDFTFSGMAPNGLADFAGIPDRGLAYVLDEYRRQGGRPVDPVLLHMTQVSHDAATVNWLADHPQRGADELRRATESLYRHLNEVAAVTGVSFSAEVAGTGPQSPAKGSRPVPAPRI